MLVNRFYYFNETTPQEVRGFHSAVKGGFTLRFGPTDQIQMSSATVWNGYMTSPLSEVRRQIVPDSWSCRTERSIAVVGPSPTELSVRVAAERYLLGRPSSTVPDKRIRLHIRLEMSCYLWCCLKNFDTFGYHFVWNTTRRPRRLRSAAKLQLAFYWWSLFIGLH